MRIYGIGHVSLACENDVVGTWGQDVNFLHVKRLDFAENYPLVRTLVKIRVGW